MKPTGPSMDSSLVLESVGYAADFQVWNIGVFVFVWYGTQEWETYKVERLIGGFQKSWKCPNGDLYSVVLMFKGNNDQIYQEI